MSETPAARKGSPKGSMKWKRHPKGEKKGLVATRTPAGTVCLWAARVVLSCLGVVFRFHVDDLSSVCRALRVLVPPPALAAAVPWRVCSCVHGLLARLCPL
jgi:hypothetical protein